MTENCVDAKISHITFKNNSLVFQFAKSKRHQNGEDHVGPWHVYAIPHETHLFPVLELARYLFKYLELLVNKTSLFQGKSQYHRYSRMFLLLIKENLEHLKTLGDDEGNLGTHSCRKGVTTMVAAGCTVSSPIVSICIRAGWVMGGVKDKYLSTNLLVINMLVGVHQDLIRLKKRLLLHNHTLISLRSRTKSKKWGKRKD